MLITTIFAYHNFFLYYSVVSGNTIIIYFEFKSTSNLLAGNHE